MHQFAPKVDTELQSVFIININCRAQMTSTASETWCDYYSGHFEKQAVNAQFRHFLRQFGAFPAQVLLINNQIQNKKTRNNPSFFKEKCCVAFYGSTFSADACFLDCLDERAASKRQTIPNTTGINAAAKPSRAIVLK